MAFGAELVVVGAVGYVASKREEWKTKIQSHQDGVGSGLYKTYFNADLLEGSSAERTSVADTLPVHLDPHAVAAIRVIEKYQDARSKWFADGMFRGEERVGDVKTHIFEEMKQWLSRVTQTTKSSEVETRLEYMRQVVMRQTDFQSHSGSRSFLQTAAEVCQHLESLLIQSTGVEWSGATKLEEILKLGRNLTDDTIGVLVCSILDEASLPGRLSSGSNPPDPIEAINVVRCLKSQFSNLSSNACGTDAADRPVIDWSTNAGRLLQALLSQKHFQKQYFADGDVLDLDAPIFTEDQDWWQSGRDPGLMAALSGEEERTAYLSVCQQLDRVVYFLSILEPYHKVTAMAGESAMLALHEKLKKIGHAVEELICAAVGLRQARLVLMESAKRHLQRLTRREAVTPAERRWMQGLRHVKSVSMDELHKNLTAECTEIKAAISHSHMADLEASVKRNLGKLTMEMESDEFQGRFAIRGVPESNNLPVPAISAR